MEVISLRERLYFFVVFEILALLGLLALSIFTVAEAKKFTPKGLKLIYVFLASTVIWNFYNALFSMEALGFTIASLLGVLLEVRYFYRRRRLFVHSKDENIYYCYDASLVGDFEQDEYELDKKLVWEDWLEEKGYYVGKETEELQNEEEIIEEIMPLEQSTGEAEVEIITPIVVAKKKETSEDSKEKRYEVLFCRKCGKELEEDEIFCSHCGTEIKK